MNNIIVKMQFGSHVYGTNLPTSDRDFKGVFIPDAQDLVMQRAAKHIKNSTKTDDSKRNTANDVDDELFSIQTYMELLRQGQTVALDMLFTPLSFYDFRASDGMHFRWQEILDNRKLLLHKGTNAFVGYTKAQAAKYGHKGERVSALRAVIDFLKTCDQHELLGYYHWHIEQLVKQINSKEAELIAIQTPAGVDGKMQDVLHLSVANRKVGYTCTVAYALQVWQLAMDKYGHRARLAETNEGIDWKATMHAVRIAAEARELLLTGQITFPRPERDLLLAIRQGQIPYKQVEELIDQGLVDIKEAELKSTLPEKPNYKLMEEIIANAHWATVRGQE